MKNSLLNKPKLFFLLVVCSFIHNISFGQSPPTLGATSGFALFTAAGAFSNIGAATTVTGDVGTNVGAFSAFPPGTLVGSKHVVDPTSAQAATDVAIAYSYLFGLTCDSTIDVTLGSGQVLTPNVYCIGAAATINGNLILDGQGDPNALFIFKINGALATSTFSNIILTDSASLCNVYWQVNGAFTLGDSSVFRGTLLVNGAIHLLEGSSLFGRGLSKAGAIDLHNNIVAIGMQPIVTITVGGNAFPGGNTTLCLEDSITLTATVTNGVRPFSYLWSPGGQTDSSIRVVPTVTTPYMVAVTVLNGCSYALDTLVVNVSSSLVVNLGNDTAICVDESITLNAGNPGSTYAWSTGATTQTILVDTSGTFYVTVTNGNCTASDTIHITLNQLPVVNIGRDTVLLDCEDSLLLNAGNAGSTFLWNTGATTQIIRVDTSGTYSVLVTNANGCSASDTIHVIKIPVPVFLNLGIDTTVCGCILLDAGNIGFTVNWCNGSSYPTLLVCESGTYCVTVSNGTCSASDTINIIVNTRPVVNLGDDTEIIDTLILDAGNPGSRFIWSTSDTTQTITVRAPGTYFVTVTDTLGCTASDTIIITAPNSGTTIGINDISGDQNLQIYPNPSNGNFSVSADRSQILLLTNMIGQLVQRIELHEGNNNTVKVEGIQNGVYFLSSSIDGRLKYKIIIAK